MWYAAGSPSSYAMAGKKGLGVLGFSVQKVSDMEWVVESYKSAVKDAEPVGAFVSDNVMVASTAICAETHAKAVEIAVGGGLSYLQSLLFRYHDTFPRPEDSGVAGAAPEYTEEIVELLIAEELMICGDPDEVLKQCRRWDRAGADQLSFGLPIGISPEDTMNTIRLIEHVIPRIDTDPVHRTSRMRRPRTDFGALPRTPAPHSPEAGWSAPPAIEERGERAAAAGTGRRLPGPSPRRAGTHRGRKRAYPGCPTRRRSP